MAKKRESKKCDSRYIPIEIRRNLRKEVGFGCPIPGCGSPFLEWHHFDPPWEPLHINNEPGMIALCGVHHPQADQGAWTDDQFRKLKKDGKRLREEAVSGQFNWLRNKLLAVVGGNFFYDTPIIFEYMSKRRLWFTRDDEGYFRLNIDMMTITGEERIVMENNDWILRGYPDDFECPPSGRLIHARYWNDDELRIEFLELKTVEDASKRYPQRAKAGWDPVTFPITAVEILNRVADTCVSFDKDNCSINGYVFRGCLFESAPCALGF